MAEMKTVLAISSALLVGMAFGCLVSLHAASRAIGSVELEAVANRSIENVAEAYEAQIQKTGIVDRLKDKFDTCVQENARLHAKIWKRSR